MLIRSSLLIHKYNTGINSTGKIQWARSLFKQLEEPMQFFAQHHVMLTLPEGREAMKRYQKLAKSLVLYELLNFDNWRKQSVS